MADVWEMMTAERNDFADFLESLTPEQWDAPSLCTQWKVRDVVGHVILGVATSKGAFLMLMLKNGFNFNKAMAKEAPAYAAERTPEVLVKELRAHADDRSLPPGLKPQNLLGDTMVHQQDCRRALNLPRTIPAERVLCALDAMKGVQPILGNKKRVAGVKLVATDMEWSWGDGPEARGTGEALLMAMNGRTAALDDLTGDGVAVMRSRA